MRPAKDGLVWVKHEGNPVFRPDPALAWEKDGITGWRRHPANPIIRPGEGTWDQDAVYKPHVIFNGRKWLLWYNGRRGGVEQIGLAVHEW